MGFEDLSSAADMRDVIEHITRGVIRRERPDIRIGKIFDYDTSTHYARVLFAGETENSLVKVHFAPNMTPTLGISSNYAAHGLDADANLVRVAGKPGGYYILGYVTGGPSSAGDGDSAALAEHIAATTDVHGIPDTSQLVYESDLETPDLVALFNSGLV